MWPVGQLRCRVCSCFFLSVFSSVISVRSLSVCLSVFYMLAALVANKRIHITTLTTGPSHAVLDKLK